jgi:membrane protein DedA with SNARE-associated domain
VTPVGADGADRQVPDPVASGAGSADRRAPDPASAAGRSDGSDATSGPHGTATDQPTGGPATEPAATGISDRWRRFSLAVVIARFAIPLAAIAAIPFLLVNNISLLVLLRPQKEFILVGGGQSRFLGEPELWLLFLAFLPLGLLVVPAFFVVGRAYRGALEDGDGPGWLHRAIPPRQLQLAQQVLAHRGPSIALLGRIAALPPTVLAAAAGLSDVDWRRYLLADAVGAVIAVSATLAAGFALGRAYEDGGPWITGIGVGLFFVLILLLTHWIRREAERHDKAERA